MDLRKIFGLKKVQDKLTAYRELKTSLNRLGLKGQELAEKFMINKSIASNIDTVPESKKNDILGNYNNFLKIHQKEVSAAINERAKILKSISRYHEDNEVGKACKDIDLIDNATKAYKNGEMKRSLFFNIVKSISGEPTKYADVIVRNREGKILILHRVKDYVPDGTVCIPGGHVDLGEDFKTAALRELKEETNLDPIPGHGVNEVGSYVKDGVHIVYYEVLVDYLQPVTVDSSEHCFSEWISIGDIALKPFIFDQGENVLNILAVSDRGRSNLLLKALETKRISKEVFSLSFTKMFEKSIGSCNAKDVSKESVKEEVRCKAVFPVRDPNRYVEKIMKALNNCSGAIVGSHLSFSKPFIIHSTTYSNAPELNTLTELEVIFSGDEIDMRKIAEELKFGFMVGSFPVNTLVEEFTAVNENGTDYVGDPIFVEFKNEL